MSMKDQTRRGLTPLHPSRPSGERRARVPRPPAAGHVVPAQATIGSDSLESEVHGEPPGVQPANEPRPDPGPSTPDSGRQVIPPQTIQAESFNEPTPNPPPQAAPEATKTESTAAGAHPSSSGAPKTVSRPSLPCVRYS